MCVLSNPDCAVFIQEQYKETAEWLAVKSMADSLADYIALDSVKNEINATNTPAASSGKIQDIIFNKAQDLGFNSEAKGLFQDYANKGLRPDYFKPMGKTGVLIEVERGKTNQNNMDFLDIWKCHICKHADYLFLFVPKALSQNASGKIVGRPFKVTSAHIGAFFQPENYINVRGVVVFGY
jgi:hypothetical protein